MPIRIEVKLVDGGLVPMKKTAGAACFDCFANESAVLTAGTYVPIRLGFCIAVPKGYEAVIRPRSGLAFNDDVVVVEGTIDSDYRGEVKALLKYDTWEGVYHIERGDRVCQMKIQRSEEFKLVEVQELESTERGEGGFGSTGK